MKRTFKIAAIVMALGTATAAFAAIDTTAVVDELQAKGYTNVEVNTRGGQVEVEAISGGQKLTLTYDAVTGALLRQETSSVERRGGNGIGAVTGADVTGTNSGSVGGHDGDDDGIDGDDDGTDDDGYDDDNGTDDDDNGTDDDDNGTDDDDNGTDDDDNGDDDNGTDDDNDD